MGRSHHKLTSAGPEKVLEMDRGNYRYKQRPDHNGHGDALLRQVQLQPEPALSIEVRLSKL